MDVINALLSVLGANSTLVLIISFFGVIIAGITIALDFRNERRARDSFSIERRRLSEVNLKITHKVRLTPVSQREASQDEQGQGAFMILQMPMENIGDGPIDILGMLGSAKQLTYDEWSKGIGARSRDVEWTDYHASYWNDEDLNGKVFAGISTTKSLINSADNFTRLAAKESGSMRRLDAVHDMGELQKLQTINVMYRIFSVARGYALGEVLRQLGGGPPDPAVNVRQELLQFQRLAQPDFRRWLCVQKALINLNRFAFRLAIFDMDNPEASQDPLGLLLQPDAWRIFLLHHWEFVDDVVDAAPKRLSQSVKAEYALPPGTIQRASAIAESFFPARRLPDLWDEEVKQKIQVAHEKCAEELKEFVLAWERLKAAIKVCEANALTGRTPKTCPNEGYPRMIHIMKEYKDRWLALMEEGYLISKPFYRYRITLWWINAGGRRRKLDTHDIPSDPRVLEPYVMRTYYFLDSLDARQLKDPGLALDEDGL